jgi:hypothetical protein
VVGSKHWSKNRCQGLGTAPLPINAQEGKTLEVLNMIYLVLESLRWRKSPWVREKNSLSTAVVGAISIERTGIVKF